MATAYLLNTVTIQKGGTSQKELAGSLIPDDASLQSALVAAGGVLAPTTDATVAAAAALAQNLHKQRGANEDALNSIMLAAAASSLTKSRPTKIAVPLALAAIQAQTSGVAFNVGSALPAGALIIDSHINVITPVTGGTLSAMNAKVQNTSETAGALLGNSAGTNVFAGTGIKEDIGSNPYSARGGQQLQMTLTATGDTLAHATAGSIELDIYYVVP